jgi:crotonobetainyl-CoA:carnitine CoA-transferase CaiB-like acyl-CoA transferase
MLSPYRVLDLTDERGLLCGQILADLGADVIKIEPPGGSAARRVGPFYNNEPHPEHSLLWWSYNRDKRSVVLDPQSEEDRERFKKLVEGADFLVESADPGAMAAVGLGYDDLAKINPALVYISITPFGQEGPKSGYKATDLTVWASSCSMALAGDDDRAPVRVSVPQSFLFAGGAAAGGALIAHLERVRSGRGQHVDVSAQLAASAAVQGYTLATALGDVELERMAGGIKLGPARISFMFPAADGYVAILFLWGTAIGPFSRKLMEWVAEEGFCDEATRDKDWINYTVLLLTGQEPIEEYERVKLCIENFTRSKTKAELMAGAFERRLLIAPVSTITDVVDSPQLAAREFWRDLEHPILGKSFRYPGPFAKFSGTPIESKAAAPTIGQHTEEVLAEHRQPARERYESGGDETSPALAGVKVLDFMWVVAGPTATRNLADYGATVVRIESSKRIETARTIGPNVNGEQAVDSGAFFHHNAGKLGVTLDPSQPAGKEAVLDLVRWADVVTESFTPKAMRAWGLDYEELRKVKPDIIMLSSCLMGQTGPMAMFAGFGNLAAALAGFANVAGWPDRPPAGPFSAYTDYVSPRFILVSILAALEHKRRTGQGQYIDLSQFEAGCHFLAPAILDLTVNGHAQERAGNDDPQMAPHGAYPTQGEDEWVAVVAANDEQWQALARTIGHEDLAGDEKLASAAGRVDHRHDLDAAVSEWTSQRDGREVESLLQKAGVSAHIVQNAAECYADPQMHHYGFFPKVQHSAHGEVTIEGSHFKLSRTPARFKHAGPTLGEHNFQVLTEILGYDGDRIAELAAAGALE